MLIKTFGCAVFGISATKVTVEVNINEGINFFMVGLPDNAIKESHKRIDAALKNNGYKIPGKCITVNMAPADLKKEGSAYDLTIAVGILAASEKIPSENLSKLIIMGELSLDGEIRPVRGALPIAIKAREEGFEGIILPETNVEEASVVEGISIYPASHLKEVIDFLNVGNTILPYKNSTINSDPKQSLIYEHDFSDVKGQENCKRALEIAAGGGHNVILIGPPGAGKTMISKRLPSIMPPLTKEEALETTKIHSVAGKLGKNFGLITRRPFRAPHHTISDVALLMLRKVH
jgi:magnesium chelatase family protein